MEEKKEKNILSTILSNIGKGIICVDLENKILFLNELAQNLTACENNNFIGKNLDDVFNITNKDIIGDFTQKAILIDKNNLKKIIKYDIFKIEDNLNIVNRIIVFQEIINEVSLNDEDDNFKKLQSIAVLAGGIAHDFNNILTCIVGNISFVKLKLNSENKVLSNLLEEAEKEAFRARDLTQQLLSLSKGYVPIKKKCSVKNLLLQSTRIFLRGSNINCIFNIQDDLSFVNVDEGQIEQVIQNLILNAIQAMPNGGDLIISAENFKIDSKNNPMKLKASDYVKIMIKDNGIGIAKENFKRIFEPYYTTKTKGCGLGLSICFSIISNHDGLLTVESKLEFGTTFYIYIKIL